MTQFRADEFLHCQPNRILRSWQGKDDGITSDAGRSATQHAGRTNFFPAEHTEDFAKAGHMLLDQSTDDREGDIPTGNTSPAIDDDCLDRIVGEPAIENRLNAVALVRHNFVGRRMMAAEIEMFADQATTGIIFARASIANRQNREADGLARGGPMFLG